MIKSTADSARDVTLDTVRQAKSLKNLLILQLY